MYRQVKSDLKIKEEDDQRILLDGSGRNSGADRKNGIYIYGIIQASGPQAFGKIGIGDNGSDIQAICFKDIAAVGSESPFIVYDTLAKEKIIKDLVTHQFVIEKVMENCTILPVKFGTMVETEDEVVEFLEQGYAVLSDTLRKMSGKIELDVVASWELSKALAAVCHNSREIQEQQENIAKKITVEIEDKVALGKLIDQELKDQKESYRQRILQTFEKESTGVCLHDVVNDEMIFNAAFLLDKQKEEVFNKAVYDLDQQLEGAINFRVVGPLPPYSFATTLFEKIDPYKLEEAKKIFGFNDTMTSRTLRDTYRQLAQKYHPDSSSSGDSQQFHLIHSAYRTLKNFLESGLIRVEVYQWEKDFQ